MLLVLFDLMFLVSLSSFVLFDDNLFFLGNKIMIITKTTIKRIIIYKGKFSIELLVLNKLNFINYFINYYFHLIANNNLTLLF